MMRVVNHLLKFLKEAWPDVSKRLDEIKVVAQPYHGGQLEGPECQRILKKLHSLQQFAETSKNPSNANHLHSQEIQ